MHYKDFVIMSLFILHSSKYCKYCLIKTFVDWEIGNILLMISKYYTVEK